MSERLALPPISDEDLAAARALYADQVAECPHCGGWSKPDPRSTPARYPSTICLNEARDTWYVRCFSCFACTSSTFTALDALERWNRRVGAAARQPEMLPLVDLESMARNCRVILTLDQEAFAIAVQRAVLARNRRPLS